MRRILGQLGFDSTGRPVARAQPHLAEVGPRGAGPAVQVNAGVAQVNLGHPAPAHQARLADRALSPGDTLSEEERPTE